MVYSLSAVLRSTVSASSASSMDEPHPLVPATYQDRGSFLRYRADKACMGAVRVPLPSGRIRPGTLGRRGRRAFIEKDRLAPQRVALEMIARIRTGFPVAGQPMNVPRWVPRHSFSVTMHASSAERMRRTRTVKSGKPSQSLR